MNPITGLLVELLAYGFWHSENVTDGTISVFHSHIDHTSVVRHIIERGVDFNTSFAKYFSDINRYPYK